MKIKDEGIGDSKIRAPRRILDAAFQEFSEHGIDGARVDEIVRRAGVSKQLFYYYFESKEEIYKIALEETADSAMNRLLIADYDQMSASAAMSELFRNIFNQYVEMPFLIKSTLDQDHHCGAHISPRNKLRALSPRLIAIVASILERGAASGEFRENVDAEFFYTATILMLRGCFVSSCTFALVNSLHPEQKQSLIAWRENTIEYALYSIRQPWIGSQQRDAFFDAVALAN